MIFKTSTNKIDNGINFSTFSDFKKYLLNIKNINIKEVKFHYIYIDHYMVVGITNNTYEHILGISNNNNF